MKATQETARRLLARWRDNPALFAQEALGVRLWFRQVEILNAVAAHTRVAVRSGHKVSKSFTAAVVALWWVCTRKRGLVVMTSSSYEQIKKILWKELARVHGEAKIAIGGVVPLDPATGFKLPDGRMIYGISTNKKERMAGVSGAELLFIVDEASGVDEEIHETIAGNAAGGAHTLMFSNPTQTVGTFFDAFGIKTRFWHGIHVSSEEAAALDPPIPGLATKAWVEEKKDEWGVDSPIYAVRVRGDFPTQASDAVVGLASVLAAIERWDETPDDGPLSLGVDPSRFGDDESIVAARRGQKVLSLHAFQGLDGPQLAGEVLRIVRELRRSDDARPRVKVDVIGIGASVFDSLKQHDAIEAIDINVSESATAEGFHLLRDQLWFSTAQWLKEGGAIPDDGKLQGDLVAPRYAFDAQGRCKVEPKADTKKRLRRSPDRADAVNLAVYEPAWSAPSVDLDVFKGLPGRRY